MALLNNLSAAEYLDGIKSNNKVLLARAITIVESILPAHRNLAEEILTLCFPYAGNAIRVGITGVPGVGKSKFIERLGNEIMHEGKKIAVLAIDPSSQKSRGSILGDKTRMEKLSVNPNAFIRPTPAGITTGGVAAKTREVMVLLEAAGYEVIFIETVGVGQSEVEVQSMTDIFLLLLLAGAGDELQGIKRGIMEMADIIAINKADGDNTEKAERARMQVNSALQLFPENEAGWTIPVSTCSAATGKGIKEIWHSIQEYITHCKGNSFFIRKRQHQTTQWFSSALHLELVRILSNRQIHSEVQKELELQVAKGKVVPSVAARRLAEVLTGGTNKDQSE
ncbi:MAG: methylmalonyl Co-A mutase-associated GTPase MeaB [Chitinophagales bacterium]